MPPLVSRSPAWESPSRCAGTGVAPGRGAWTSATVWYTRYRATISSSCSAATTTAIERARRRRAGPFAGAGFSILRRLRQVVFVRRLGAHQGAHEVIPAAARGVGRADIAVAVVHVR